MKEFQMFTFLDCMKKTPNSLWYILWICYDCSWEQESMGQHKFKWKIFLSSS